MDVSSRGLNRRSVLVLNSHSAVTTEPTHQNECRRWKTGISPFIDEEICWWGYWCCWLVQARTTDSFGVGSSRVQITYAILYLVGSALIFHFIGPFAGISFATIGSIVLACIRASVRSGIRRKLNIFGTFFDDFLTHLCCPSCAICQEAREGKVLRNDPVDFCTGEKLLVQEETYRNNTGQNKRSSADTAVEGDKFYNHLRSISKVSVIILVLSTVALLLLLVIIGINKQPTHMAVVFVILVQPVVILYFVYWRARRHQTSLDLVIKCFAIGYWLSSVQCQSLRFFTMPILYAVAGLISVGGYKMSDAPSTLESIDPWLFVSPASNSTTMLNVTTTNTTITAPFSNITLHNADHGLSIPFSTDAGVTPSPTHDIFFLFILYISLVVSVFVLNVAIDESVKHYIVRCFPFTSPLKNPQCVLVYLLSGALGFTTTENLENIPLHYLNGGNVIYGVIPSVLKILIPIHVLCAYLQAFNLTKVSIQKIDMSLFRILLSSIFLHGVYDLACSGAVTLSHLNNFIYYVPHACASIVTMFSLYWWRLSSKYTKMESELGNHEDDEDYDDASEIALLL